MQIIPKAGSLFHAISHIAPHSKVMLDLLHRHEQEIASLLLCNISVGSVALALTTSCSCSLICGREFLGAQTK